VLKVPSEICDKHLVAFAKGYFSTRTMLPPEMMSHTHSASSKFPRTLLEYDNNRTEAWLQIHKIQE